MCFVQIWENTWTKIRINSETTKSTSYNTHRVEQTKAEMISDVNLSQIDALTNQVLEILSSK